MHLLVLLTISLIYANSEDNVLCVALAVCPKDGHCKVITLFSIILDIASIIKGLIFGMTR